MLPTSHRLTGSIETMKQLPNDELAGLCVNPCFMVMAALLSAIALGGTAIHAEPSVSFAENESASLLPTSSSLLQKPSTEKVRSGSTGLELARPSSLVGSTMPASNSMSAGSIQSADAMGAMFPKPASLSAEVQGDRLWLLSTRHMTSTACRANLRNPNFQFNRLDRCGRRSSSDLGDYLSTMTTDRPRIIYIHGNRRDAPTAISQGLWVYRQIASRRPNNQPFDWVIWSWPSDAESVLISDARKKAQKTDAQGLYVAWLLTQHHAHAQPTSLIGFSFGARVVSGSLHALAGGTVGRRSLDQPAITGANFDVGLLAPAVDNTWMSSCGQHRYANQNINEMVMLYNKRDIALKYFRFISGNSNAKALGCTGPRYMAPRHDGTRLPIRARDCASTVGNHHSEQQYYKNSCYAGREMASLISSSLIVH